MGPVGTLFKIELATATRWKTLLVIGQRTSTRTGIGPERSNWLLLIGPKISLISYYATSRPVIGRPLRAWPVIGRPLRALACDWTTVESPGMWLDRMMRVWCRLTGLLVAFLLLVGALLLLDNNVNVRQPRPVYNVRSEWNINYLQNFENLCKLFSWI